MSTLGVLADTLKNPISRAKKAVGHPVYATATTLSGALAGLIGSVYGNDVARAFPFAWHGPWDDFSVHALVFWVSLSLFGVLFFFRQRSDDDIRNGLIQTSEGIADLVATLPPKSFRGQLAVAVKDAKTALDALLPRAAVEDVTTDDLAALARGLLRQIAELARAYDDKPIDGEQSAVYAANVMLFVPARHTDPAFRPDLVKALRFLPRDVDLRKLRGVLWMSPTLFASHESDAVATFPELTLPVAAEPQVNGKWTVLPGGPRAFVTDQVDGYLDTGTIGEFCRLEGDFLDSVVDDLQRYFTTGPGKTVRSFISRPLDHNGESLGVLNLHSSRTDILGPAEGRRAIFQVLITSLLLDLGEVVDEYVKKSKVLE